MDEYGEDVVLILNSVPTGNATIDTDNDTHEITINDNDDPPTVSFGSPSSYTIDEDATNPEVTIPVSLSAESAKQITVPFSLAGSATGGDDYTVTPAGYEVSHPNYEIVIPAETSTISSIIYTIVEDSEGAEGFETIELSMGDPTNAVRDTANDFVEVTIDDDDPDFISYLDDMEGYSSPGRNKNFWNANVKIWVVDQDGNPVAYATITGTWSNGASGNATCMTGASGHCTVTKADLKKKDISSVDFTVADVDDGGAHVYMEANNVVTSITVNQ
jgi:hypothetical protein